jgi:ribosome-binding protein aMBF1 (putative translation factor)
MTVTKILEQDRKEGAQIKACLVTEDRSLKSIQDHLADTHAIIISKENLVDVFKEPDCNLYIVDTEVKDLDIWPAPLLTIPDAWSKDWMFLVSRPSDAFSLQPLPQNARFLDRKKVSIEEITSLIKKQLDPESQKRLAKVRYLENIKVFVVQMENGKTYAINISEISEADSTKVVKWQLSRSRDHIRVAQESGNQFEIPWDEVLYHREPQYEYYKGKHAEYINIEQKKIGQTVRETREKKGYSVQELANKSGMKRPNLSRLEHGHHQPSLETLERIAEALGIPVIDLIRGKN